MKPRFDCSVTTSRCSAAALKFEWPPFVFGWLYVPFTFGCAEHTTLQVLMEALDLERWEPELFHAQSLLARIFGSD